MSVSNFANMFADCTELETVTFPSTVDTNEAVSFESACDGCTKLTSVTMPSTLKTTSTINMSNAFRNCTSLQNLSINSLQATGNIDLTNLYSTNTGNLTIEPSSSGTVTFNNTLNATTSGHINIPTASASTFAFVNTPAFTAPTITSNLDFTGIDFTKATKSDNASLTSITNYPEKLIFKSSDIVIDTNARTLSVKTNTTNNYLQKYNYTRFDVVGDNTEIFMNSIDTADKFYSYASNPLHYSTVDKVCTITFENEVIDSLYTGKNSGNNYWTISESNLPDWASDMEYRFVFRNMYFTSGLPYMFQNTTQISSVTIDDTNRFGDVPYRFHRSFKNSKVSTVELPTSIDTPGYHDFESTFENCTNITSVALPDFPSADYDSVRMQVYKYTCNGCINLETFILRLTTQNRGDMLCSELCSGCTKLTSVTLPNSIKGYDIYFNKTFMGCTSLETVTLPYFECRYLVINYVFDGCTNLRNVTLHDVALISGYSTFGNINAINMFRNCIHISHVIIPNIPINWDSGSLDCDGMFYNCKELTDISFVQSTIQCKTHINFNNMFQKCTALQSVTLPTITGCVNNVNLSSMFDGCTSLTSQVIPSFDSAITSLNCSRIFNGCTSLTSATLPSAPSCTGSVNFFEACYNANLSTVTLNNIHGTTLNLKNFFKGRDVSITLSNIEMSGEITINKTIDAPNINALTLSNINAGSYNFTNLAFIATTSMLSDIDLTTIDFTTAIKGTDGGLFAHIDNVDYPSKIIFKTSDLVIDTAYKTAYVKTSESDVYLQTFEYSKLVTNGDNSELTITKTIDNAQKFANFCNKSFNRISIGNLTTITFDGIIIDNNYVDNRRWTVDETIIDGYGNNNMRFKYVFINTQFTHGAPMMFKNTTRVQEIDIQDTCIIDTDNVDVINFENICESSKNLITFKFSPVINTNGQFVMNNACYNCAKLETIVLPESITAANISFNDAFKYCASLVNVTFPTTLATPLTINHEIQLNSMFASDSSLQTFTFANSISTYYISLAGTFIDSGITSMTINPSTLSITYEIVFENTFKNCISLSTLVLPTTITACRIIYSYICQNCTSLNSLTMPNMTFTKPETTNPSSDMKNSFDGCNNLETLTFGYISSNVTVDELNCFELCKNCTSLSAFTYPTISCTINTISLNGAFENCISLSTLSISTGTVGTLMDMSNLYTGNDLTLTISNITCNGTMNLTNMIEVNALSITTSNITTNKIISTGVICNVDDIIVGDFSGFSFSTLDASQTGLSLIKSGAGYPEKIIFKEADVVIDSVNRLAHIKTDANNVYVQTFMYDRTSTSGNNTEIYITQPIDTLEKFNTYASNHCSEENNVVTITFGNCVIDSKLGTNSFTIDETQLPLYSSSKTYKFVFDYVLFNSGLPTLFKNTSQITDVIFNDSCMFGNDVNILKESFYKCSDLTNLKLPSEIIISGSIDMTNMCRETQLETLTIPSLPNITDDVILDYVCYHCSLLNTITMPTSFNNTGVVSYKFMFETCTNLKTVSFPINTQNTNAYFTSCCMNCTSLTRVVFPTSINSSDNVSFASACANCSALTSVVLPTSVTTTDRIEYNSMFAGCESLNTITMPVSNASRIFINSLYTTSTRTNATTFNFRNISCNYIYFTDWLRTNNIQTINFSELNVNTYIEINAFINTLGITDDLDLSMFDFNKASKLNNQYILPDSSVCKYPERIIFATNSIDINSVNKVVSIRTSTSGEYIQTFKYKSLETSGDNTILVLSRAIDSLEKFNEYANNSGSYTTSGTPCVITFKNVVIDSLYGTNHWTINETLLPRYSSSMTYKFVFDNVEFTSGLPMMFANTTKVTEVVMNDNCKFGYGIYMFFKVFYRSTISSITWPTAINNVTNLIFDNTFVEASNLTTLTLPSSNTTGSIKYSNTFKKCTNLETVTFGDYSNATGDINFSSAFESCTSLKTVTFGDMTNIGNNVIFDGSFNNCSALETMSIPSFENATGRANYAVAFHECINLTSLTIGNIPLIRRDVTFYAMCENDISLKTLTLPSVISTNNNYIDYNFGRMCTKCVELTTISLPRCLVIGNVIEHGVSFGHAFERCPSLTSLSISYINCYNLSLPFMYSGNELEIIFSYINADTVDIEETIKVTNLNSCVISDVNIGTLNVYDNFIKSSAILSSIDFSSLTFSNATQLQTTTKFIPLITECDYPAKFTFKTSDLDINTTTKTASLKTNISNQYFQDFTYRTANVVGNSTELLIDNAITNLDQFNSYASRHYTKSGNDVTITFKNCIIECKYTGDSSTNAYWTIDKTLLPKYSADINYIIEFNNVEFTYGIPYMFNNVEQISRVTMTNTCIFGDDSYILYHAFDSAKSISRIQLPGTINISVTDINLSYACYQCTGLTSLVFPAFPNVTGSANLEYLCAEATSLSTVVYPLFNNMTGTYDLNYTCRGCSALSTVRFYNVLKATKLTMDYSFEDCSSLSSITLPEYGSESNTGFSIVYGLKNTAISSLTVHNLSNVNGDLILTGMCYSCKNLTSITFTSDINNVLTPGNNDSVPVIKFDLTFAECSSLPSVSLPNISALGTIYFDQTFKNCTSLTSLTLPTINSQRSLYLYSICNGCSSLKNVTNADSLTGLTGFYTNNMFNPCNKLETLTLKNIIGQQVELLNMCKSDTTSINLSNITSTGAMNLGNMIDANTVSSLNIESVSAVNFNNTISPIFNISNLPNNTDFSAIHFHKSNTVPLFKSGINLPKQITFNTDDVEIDVGNKIARIKSSSGYMQDINYKSTFVIEDKTTIVTRNTGITDFASFNRYCMENNTVEGNICIIKFNNVTLDSRFVATGSPYNTYWTIDETKLPNYSSTMTYKFVFDNTEFPHGIPQLFKQTSKVTEVSISDKCVFGSDDNLLFETFNHASALTSFRLPTSIDSSGNISFYNLCNSCKLLTTVTLPSLPNITGNVILDYAVINCSGLTTFNYPDMSNVEGNVSMISLFEGCTSLSSSSLPVLPKVKGNLNFTSMFRNLSGINSITQPSQYDNEGDVIFDYTYQNCINLSGMMYPSFPLAKGNASFISSCEGCTNMINVSVPELPSLKLNATFDRICYGNDKLESITFPMLPKAHGNIQLEMACFGCTKLTSIVLP